MFDDLKSAALVIAIGVVAVLLAIFMCVIVFKLAGDASTQEKRADDEEDKLEKANEKIEELESTRRH